MGTILESDSVNFLAGILAHRGFFGFEPAVLAARLGAVLVDNVLFLAGHFAGDSGFVRHILSRGPARRMRARLDAYTVPAILGFRFPYGMRTVGAVMIGTTSVRWQRFAGPDLIAVLVWAHLLAGAGYLAGQAVQLFFGRLALHWHILATGALFLAGAGLLWYPRAAAQKEG